MCAEPRQQLDTYSSVAWLVARDIGDVSHRNPSGLHWPAQSDTGNLIPAAGPACGSGRYLSVLMRSPFWHCEKHKRRL